MWYVCTVEYYSALNKKGILSFGTKWMNLEDTMQSEISQTQKENLHDIICIWNVKKLNS